MSKSPTDRQQKLIDLRVPWITFLPTPEPCIGWLARTPLKAIYSMGDRPPVGLDNYRCSKPGRWRFKSLKKSFARDGVYCDTHVGNAAYADNHEYERLMRHYRRRGIPVEPGA